MVLAHGAGIVTHVSHVRRLACCHVSQVKQAEFEDYWSDTSDEDDSNLYYTATEF